MTDPALDQPQLSDYDDISADARFPQANSELYFVADRDSDLYDLRWHWHRRSYARAIRIRIDAPIYTSSGISSEQLDDVIPLAVQLYPGYQETIYGVEGVIVSKRIFAPLDSYYDRSLLWMMEAQAEGDRLIQIIVEIDWGEPLEQRMVDGLLVAQKDPSEAKGMHGQRNAESTRVFGAAEGRPDSVQFPTDSQALLVYHVLVAGQVDLPLILTLSDVGEQVAWNGFLVQRDIARAFKRSRNRWHDITHRGRLWTPDAQVNRAVQEAKIGAMQKLARFRTGFAPADRQVCSVSGLVDLFDTCAPQHSRALLDSLRRVAERTGGALPRQLPTLPREESDAPAAALPFTAAAYLLTLHAHQQRHPNLEWLSAHSAALIGCAEQLIAHRRQNSDLAPDAQVAAWRALAAASALAQALDHSANAARWEGEAEAMARRRASPLRRGRPQIASEGEGQARAATDTGPAGEADMTAVEYPSSIQEALLWPPARRSAAAETTIWEWLGLSAANGYLSMQRDWPAHWGWWALLNLPYSAGEENDEISLLWDGKTLHSTRPLTFDGPLEIHSQVRAFGSDEHSFDLRFHLDGELFRPEFAYDADTLA